MAIDFPDDVPPGPVLDYLKFVHPLYEAAGKPPLRNLGDAIGCAHTTVERLLKWAPPADDTFAFKLIHYLAANPKVRTPRQRPVERTEDEWDAFDREALRLVDAAKGTKKPVHKAVPQEQSPEIQVSESVTDSGAGNVQRYPYSVEFNEPERFPSEMGAVITWDSGLRFDQEKMVETLAAAVTGGKPVVHKRYKRGLVQSPEKFGRFEADDLFLHVWEPDWSVVGKSPVSLGLFMHNFITELPKFRRATLLFETPSPQIDPVIFLDSLHNPLSWHLSTFASEDRIHAQVTVACFVLPKGVDLIAPLIARVYANGADGRSGKLGYASLGRALEELKGNPVSPLWRWAARSGDFRDYQF
ncbi:hypothetical protein [Streptomyces sp. NBC_01483]|uniref:hypothetical protein n=1 Tax=Streptomyces sp. NBC_01483 TaxID=2903883 RepID=UPI002E347003|nr:hypothetical protein [Streptomyces sp. NBC_01483]